MGSWRVIVTRTHARSLWNCRIHVLKRSCCRFLLVGEVCHFHICVESSGNADLGAYWHCEEASKPSEAISLILCSSPESCWLSLETGRDPCFRHNRPCEAVGSSQTKLYNVYKL